VSQNFDRSEYFYDQFKSHAVFGVLSLGLIVTTLVIIYQDWNREWKPYQREFRNVQIEQTEQELATATKAAEDKVAQLETELEEAKKVFEEQQREYELAVEELDKAEADKTVKRILFQSQKAVSDEAKYRYEHMKNHGPEGDVEDHEAEVAKAQEAYKKEDEKARKFQNDYNTSELELAKAQAAVDAFTDDINRLEKSLVLATAERDRFDRKLTSIRKNLFNDAFRNLPIADMLAPSEKINQVIIEDVKDNLHYVQVRKIDRCHTCHVGIDKPGFEDAEQPLTTHPNLELYVTDQSPHPMKQIGCTVCHEGNGMATQFVRAAHTPRDYEQKKEWEDKYHWHKLHHWEHPMLPKGNEQTSCYKCHTDPEQIPEADVLLQGHTLYIDKGCYACHSIDNEPYKNLRKPGPGLTEITQKLTPAWTQRWIADPWKFRPDTSMPKLFYNENTRDPKGTAQDDVMVEAITRYLYETSKEDELPAPPVEGDVERGRELTTEVGCMACHVIDEINDPIRETAENYNESNQGPNLSNVGSKTNTIWLYHWLKNPEEYWHETVMPSMRLSDQEAADIAAYLGTLRDDAYLLDPLPTSREEIMDDLLIENLRSKLPEKDIEDKLAAMTYDEKLLELGHKGISQKQCYSCHDINGFEEANPIILDFTAEGQKHITRFDFGFTSHYLSDEMKENAKKAGEPINSFHHHHHSVADSSLKKPYRGRENLTGAATLRFPEKFGNKWVPYATDDDPNTVEIDDVMVPHSRTWYFYHQVKNPQIWDRGKGKSWWNKTRMGQFGLTDAEAHALTIFLAAQKESFIDSELVNKMDEHQKAVSDGRSVLKKYNCQSCHSVGLYPDTLKIDPVDPDDIYAGGNPEVPLGSTRLWSSKPVQGTAELFDEDGNVIGSERRRVLEAHKWILGDIYDKEYDEMVGAADYLMNFNVREIEVYGKNEGWVRQFYDSIALAPPVLYEQGRKTKYDWLYDWLNKVHTIRPHIKVRMPQYNYLADDDVEKLVHFFAGMDREPYPYEYEEERGVDDELVALGHEVFGNLVKCNLCHPAGNVMPTNSNQSAWAPNMALSQNRLKTEWIKRWLRNPQSIYPGTLMPNNFYLPEGDGLTPTLGPEEQMEEYIESLTQWMHATDQREAKTDYPSLFEFEREAAAALAAQQASAASSTSDEEIEEEVEEEGDDYTVEEEYEEEEYEEEEEEEEEE
jgi:cbb3-type cytochrome oxidase cytochrome c subunit